MGIETGWHHHRENPAGEVIEIQSCPSGPGLVGTMATSSGLYGIGAQWGFAAAWGPIVVGITPQIGISHDSYGYRELPMGTQFEVGGWVWGSYRNFVGGVKYWHLSNAGLHNTDRRPNRGLDMVGVMGGYVFE